MMKVMQSFSSLKSFCVVAFLGTSLCVAHATSLTYDLTGVTTSVGSITGSVSIDTSTLLVTSADIVFNDSTIGSPEFTTVNSVNVNHGIGQASIAGGSNSPLNNGGHLDLYYDTAKLGIGNLAICTDATPCGNQFNQGSFVIASAGQAGGRFDLTAGELDPGLNGPVAAAAEPPTLLLMGTAILLLASLMARVSGRQSTAGFANQLAE